MKHTSISSRAKTGRKLEGRPYVFLCFQPVEINITEFSQYMPCLPCVRSFGWSKFGGLPFEDNIVSKGNNGVYVKCSVIWWLLVLAIKLHVSGSNSNFLGKKCRACYSLCFFSVLFCGSTKQLLVKISTDCKRRASLSPH